MRNFISKSGLSLVELLISMMLIAVLLLGIYVINSVLGNNNIDYGQRYLVKSETQTTLNHMLNNASLAVGSGINTTLSNGSSVLDQGILYGVAGMGDANSICIHQDISSTIPVGDTIDNTPANNTSGNYNDDRWLCYTWYSSADLNYPYQIRYCAEPYQPKQASYRGATSCTGVAGSLYLGTSKVAPIVSFSPAAAGGQWTFGVELSTCLNNSASTCTVSSGLASTSDVVNNPVVTLIGNVNPPQEGMQQS